MTFGAIRGLADWKGKTLLVSCGGFLAKNVAGNGLFLGRENGFNPENIFFRPVSGARFPE